MTKPRLLAAMRTLIAIVALLTGTAVHDFPVRAQAPARPDLTGTWVLNRELTDRVGTGTAPEDADRGGRRAPPGGGMGGPGGMGGRGGGMRGPGAGGGMPDREEMERRRSAMDAAMRVPSRLIIVNGESGLVVTDEEGVSMRIPVEGKKDTGAVNGVPFETTSKWEGAALRVERKFKGGLKVVDHYSVAGEARLLTVTSKIEGGRGGRTVSRVYDSSSLQR